jgi:hypothetical protein
VPVAFCSWLFEQPKKAGRKQLTRVDNSLISGGHAFDGSDCSFGRVNERAAE